MRGGALFFGPAMPEVLEEGWSTREPTCRVDHQVSIECDVIAVVAIDNSNAGDAVRGGGDQLHHVVSV